MWMGTDILLPLSALKVEFLGRIRILRWFQDFCFQQRQKWQHLPRWDQIFEGLMEHKLRVCVLVGKQSPAIRALCKERQSSGSERNVPFAFSYFFSFCQNQASFGYPHVIGSLMELNVSLLSFLAHFLLSFLFPWLVAGFFFFFLAYCHR